jgi:ABC-2 type transport system permease protein
MKFRTVIWDTYQECLGKKVLLIYPLLSTLVILSLTFLIRVNISEGRALISAFFGGDSTVMGLSKMQEVLLGAEGAIAVALYTAGLYLSVFATADLVPGMMQRGRLDLYLSRPISRPMLLFGRFTGATAIITANVLYAVIGIWLVVGIKTGLWNFSFFYAAGAIIFMFVVLYSLMMLVGILSGSTAVTIIITYVVMAISPLLSNRGAIDAIINSAWVRGTLDILYWCLPKYSEVTTMVYKLASGGEIESWTPLLSSMLTGFVLFQITIILFSRRDI